MGVTEFLATYITQFIHSVGYSSVFILMTMESMVFPVPSEAVMPFAGFLIAEKTFSFGGVLVISTLGSIFGSLISYYAGYYGGVPFVRKFGRYVMLDEEELEATHKYFNKYGDITILICRFVPVIRHLISIPAGTGKMNIVKFIMYTVIGAGIWNGFLAYAGMVLKSNWEMVMKYSKIIDIAVLAFLLLLVCLFVYRHLKKMAARKKK
jgi:membrane protein DedA with SNARE-associated domain